MQTHFAPAPLRRSPARPRIVKLMRVAAILIPAAFAAGFTSLERLGIPAAKLDDAHWKMSGTATFDLNRPYQAFLDRYVRTDRTGINRVAYGKVSKADKAGLAAYVKTLEKQKVTSANRTAQLAYWVNLYNAKTLSVVLDHYPVKSIRDIKFGAFSAGPWSKKLLTVEGRALSLNDIEHRIVRPLFRDQRVHYVLNCAALGCPNLGKKAFSGANIVAEMDKAARTYVNHPRAVSVSAKGKVTASKIYGWFVEDFGGNARGVLAELRRYARPELAGKLSKARRIGGYAYDWALNDQRTAAGS